jgi:hypothetical protein
MRAKAVLIWQPDKAKVGLPEDLFQDTKIPFRFSGYLICELFPTSRIKTLVSFKEQKSETRVKQ